VQILGGNGGALWGDTLYHGYAVKIDAGASGYRIIGVDTDNCVTGRVLDSSSDPTAVIIACGGENRFGANPFIGAKSGVTTIFGDSVALKAGGNVVLTATSNGQLRLFPSSTPAEVTVAAILYDNPSGTFHAGVPSGWKTLAYNQDLLALEARVAALEA
jgi:hypothetical protein